MNLLEQTIKICQKYDIMPARSRGQNFLIDEKIYDSLIKAANLGEDEVVLEVGPGLGFLTEKLAEKVNKVVAVELDDKLCDILRARLREQRIRNVEIVNEDILTSPLAPLLIRRGEVEQSKPGRGYKIVANLPYNITSIFLRKFIGGRDKPEVMVLMLQKEVAERITAIPGKMSLLAVSVQFYSEPEILDYVSKDKFWPEPEVDSAIIKLKIKNDEFKIDEKKFFQMVKFGFSSRRKMLKNNLAAGYKLRAKEVGDMIKKAGFNEKIRAQELSVVDWTKLFGKLG